MINYVPERIYAKIKDDPSFIEIDKLAKDRFSKSGTLLDVVMFDNNIKEDDGWMYDMMTNALLEMLNEKPMSEIKSILIKYSEKCLKMQLTKVGVRCSLFELSSDYDKIVYIAEELRDQGMYII